MFKDLAIGLFAGALLAAAPQPAGAQYNGVTPAEATSALTYGGVPVRTTSNPNVLAYNGGFLNLTDCNAQGRCTELNFFNNFNDVRPTLEAVNRWNSTKKIPEASVNADGSLHMEVWLSGVGATDAIIVDTVQWFVRYAADIEFWGPYIVKSGV